MGARGAQRWLLVRRWQVPGVVSQPSSGGIWEVEAEVEAFDVRGSAALPRPLRRRKKRERLRCSRGQGCHETSEEFDAEALPWTDDAAGSLREEVAGGDQDAEMMLPAR